MGLRLRDLTYGLRTARSTDLQASSESGRRTIGNLDRPLVPAAAAYALTAIDRYQSAAQLEDHELVMCTYRNI